MGIPALYPLNTERSLLMPCSEEMFPKYHEMCVMILTDITLNNVQPED